MKRNDTEQTDKTLRLIIKDRLPQPPNDPLFTRKVLNRLPDRSSRPISIIETAGYIAAFIVIVVMMATTACDIKTSRTVTVENIVTVAALSCTFITVTTAMIRSLVFK